ncbi:MAG: hypothetical protein DME24_17090 [Verrucomicrobia bacterium]|nr:MAG: hypothetical protein DME24_17090 [Verrucomicrobiota bacterium]
MTTVKASLIANVIALLTGVAQAADAAGRQSIDRLWAGRFNWTVGPPLVSPAVRPEDPCQSVKDPSLVRHNGRWHLFCTIRSQKRTHQIEYLSFADWKDADKSERHVLKISKGYFCAPQVFYFAPQKKWYLICQVNEPSRKPALQPAFSTTGNPADPDSWSKPTLLYAQQPARVRAWIDFWVICDDARAHLFFTSNDGRMWRAETKMADFPGGWNEPAVVLRDDIFEASHTYRLKGLNKFLTVVEAQDGGRRYSHWTDSFSHGELLRDGFDQNLEVDPVNLRFLFQGVTDEAKRGKAYGDIPWRLGILEPADQQPSMKHR